MYAMRSALSRKVGMVRDHRAASADAEVDGGGGSERGTGAPTSVRDRGALGGPVDPPERHLVAPERRHDVGAGDAIAHRREHLARDAHALFARGWAAARGLHSSAHFGGDLHARDLVVEELGV